MKVSEVLKKLRKAHKITQEQIAEFLEIKRTAYASYETARVNIDTGLLQKLANYYNVTVDSILNGTAITEDVVRVKTNDSQFDTKEERLLRIEAHLEVFEAAIAGLLAKNKNEVSDKVSLLRSRVLEAEKRLLSGLTKQS